MSFPGDYNGAIPPASAMYGIAGGRGPPPRPGQDDDFDTYCAIQFGDVDPSVADIAELRKAAWATWKISAPSGSRGPSTSRHAEEDDELARALALSAQEHEQQKRPRRHSVIVIDDSDDEDAGDAETARALAASVAYEGERAAKRQRREQTPEEERRMLAEALAASLAQTQAQADAPPADEAQDNSDNDANIEAGTVEYLAWRQAFREEELRRRGARSGKTSANPTPAASPPRPASQTASSSTATTLDLKALMGDRAQLEKERLARQAARQAGAARVKPKPTPSSPSTSDSRPAIHARPIAVAGPSMVHTLSSIGNGSSASTSTSSASKGAREPTTMDGYRYRPTDHPLQAAGPFPKDAAGEFYPDGELRHVALSIVPPTAERTFRPQDMIGAKSEIAFIIMSSFVIDDEWLATIMPSPKDVPTIMIRPHPKDRHAQLNGAVVAMESGEVVCHPKMMSSWGSAHMKFAWIFYNTGRLRVAISTANMVPYDWEIIENTVFIQDFLPPQSSAAVTSRMGDDFRHSFIDLFNHLKLPRGLRQLKASHRAGHLIQLDPADNCANTVLWDWSRVRVRLVLSIAGTYEGTKEMDKWGLCRLARVLEEERWTAENGELVRAEYQGSSLGQYSLDWFDSFYRSCCGTTARHLLEKPKPSGWPPMKVLFPTLATVDASLGGRAGGGTMFCGKAMNSVTRPLFHDANSKRGGVLMHTKMLIAIFEPQGLNLGVPLAPQNGKRKADDREEHTVQAGGWIYVGSHNFSSAAWGTVNKKNKPPTLAVKNYEMGIVFPLPRGKANEVADKVAPYRRPPRAYAAHDVPWSQDLMPRDV